MNDIKSAQGVVPTLDIDQTNQVPLSGDQTPHEEKADSLQASSLEDGVKGESSIEEKSRGVIEMEALIGRLNPVLLGVLYGFFALLAYVLSLNQYTSTTFFNTAVSRSFKAHALQATIRTITSVFQAMSQPPIAKLADVFGRVNTYVGCVFFYVLGYIVVACSTSVVTYAVGNSIYILGITGLFLLQNIIISDISSLRNRYWWTIFPNIPGAINAFVGGDVASGLLAQGNPSKMWRWGFGIFIIMTPVLALPIILTLWRYTRPTRVVRPEMAAAKAARTPQPLAIRAATVSKSLFWQLDLIGLTLFVIGFGLFFVTITLANSRTSRWSDAHSIAQLVLGGVFIAGFVAYERWFAPHPLLPFSLLKRKTVVGSVLIALFHPMAGRIVGGYLYTFLIVAADQSVLSTQRITNFPTVAGTVTTILGAAVARYYRRLKPIIIFGFLLQLLGTGLMIRYRTSTNSQGELAVVQLIRGAANGFIPFPVQAMIQAAAPHEHLAAITAGWLVVYYLSGGIGSAIGGALWTNLLPKRLDQYFGEFTTNQTLINYAYVDPLTFADEFPMGSPERMAVARAQDETQRIIVITGLCVSVLAALTSIFLLDNFKLTDEQSLPESEEYITAAEKDQKKANVAGISPAAVRDL